MYLVYEWMVNELHNYVVMMLWLNVWLWPMQVWWIKEMHMNSMKNMSCMNDKNAMSYVMSCIPSVMNDIKHAQECLWMNVMHPTWCTSMIPYDECEVCNVKDVSLCSCVHKVCFMECMYMKYGLMYAKKGQMISKKEVNVKWNDVGPVTRWQWVIQMQWLWSSH